MLNFDPNERKYFITAQSVALAIQEEQARAAKSSDTSEAISNIPNPSESKPEQPRTSAANDPKDIKALEREIQDLKITNRAKDYFIDQLKEERSTYEEQLMASSRKVGELETRLLQLEAPGDRSAPSSEPTFRSSQN